MDDLVPTEGTELRCTKRKKEEGRERGRGRPSEPVEERVPEPHAVRRRRGGGGGDRRRPPRPDLSRRGNPRFGGKRREREEEDGRKKEGIENDMEDDETKTIGRADAELRDATQPQVGRGGESRQRHDGTARVAPASRAKRIASATPPSNPKLAELSRVGREILAQSMPPWQRGPISLECVSGPNRFTNPFAV